MKTAREAFQLEVVQVIGGRTLVNDGAELVYVNTSALEIAVNEINLDSPEAVEAYSMWCQVAEANLEA